MQIPDHESINETLQTAKKLLQQNNLEEAKDCLTQILESQPAHREALYYSAVAERQQKNVSAANEAIARLLKHHNDYGRGHQEQGHLLLSQDLAAEALTAYKRAVELNPALSQQLGCHG